MQFSELLRMFRLVLWVLVIISRQRPRVEGCFVRKSGGAGMLKSGISSKEGAGGILLAVYYVCFNLYESKRQPVGDVFDKLTGKFDENAAYQI
jgi:hypothetical protein